MSDAELRDLERRWHESGAVADQAAWLSARVRAGELAEERLRLLAHLGHEASRVAAGQPPLPEPTSLDDLNRWLSELAAFGKPTLIRAAIAAARPDQHLRLAKPWPNDIGDAIDFAERWLRSGELPPKDYPLSDPSNVPGDILYAVATDDLDAIVASLQAVARGRFFVESPRIQADVIGELLPWALEAEGD